MKTRYSLLVAFLAGISGGFVGNSCSNYVAEYLEQKVRAQFSSAEVPSNGLSSSEFGSIVVPVVEQRDIRFQIIGKDQDLASVPWETILLPSEMETFFATEANDDYLAGKVGFQYEVKNVDWKDFRHPTGSEWTFEIRDHVKIQQLLKMKQYDGQDPYLSSTFEIVVVNRQITEIMVGDSRHNTSLKLERSHEGNLEYKNSQFTEEQARQFYDLYADIFTRFKSDHHIDARIEAYAPQLNVTVTLP